MVKGSQPCMHFAGARTPKMNLGTRTTTAIVSLPKNIGKPTSVIITTYF